MVVTEKEIREFETECLAGGQRKGRLRPAHYLPDLATCDQLGRPHVVWLEVGVPAVKNRQRLGLSSDLGPCIKTGQHVVKSSRVGVHMWEDRKTKEVEALSGLFSSEEELEDWFDKRKWSAQRQAIVDDIRETNKKERRKPKSPPKHDARKPNDDDAEKDSASKVPRSPMLLGPSPLQRQPTFPVPEQKPISAEKQPVLGAELPDEIEPETEPEQPKQTAVMDQLSPRLERPEEIKPEPKAEDQRSASRREGSRGGASDFDSTSAGGTYSSLSEEEEIDTPWLEVTGPYGGIPPYGVQPGNYLPFGYPPGAVPYYPMPYNELSPHGLPPGSYPPFDSPSGAVPYYPMYPGAMPPPSMGQPLESRPPNPAPTAAREGSMPAPSAGHAPTQPASRRPPTPAVHAPASGTSPSDMRRPPEVPEVPPAPVRLRLLITASINKRYCFSRRVLQLFSKHLDLSMEHVMMLNGYISKGDFMSWNDGEDEAYLAWYSLGPDISRDPVLICRHNSSTGVTNGLVILHEPYNFASDGAWFQSIVSTITDRCAFANDPFLTSAAICKYVHDHHFSSWCGANGVELSRLKEELQLQTKGFDPLENDFISSTKIIQRLQEGLTESCGPIHANEILIRRLRHAATKAAVKNDEQMINNPSSPWYPTKDRGKGRAEGVELLMVDCECESKRLLNVFAGHTLNLQSIQQLVSNYMAIKEARVNGELARSSMEIAKATMRDSSAMKSIAVLTMVFLPATAVAAIFDTPFFEWTSDNEEGKFTTRNFSTYWNITAPLTVAVMIIWFLLVRPEEEWLEKGKNLYKEWKDALLLRKWRAYVSGDKPEDPEKYAAANQNAYNNNPATNAGRQSANIDPRTCFIDKDIAGAPGPEGENWQSHVTGAAELSGWKYLDDTLKNVVEYVVGKKGGYDFEPPISPHHGAQLTVSELGMGSLRVEFDHRPDEPRKAPTETQRSRRRSYSPNMETPGPNMETPGPKTITEWGETESAPRGDASPRRSRSFDSELENSDMSPSRGKDKETPNFTMPNRTLGTTETFIGFMSAKEMAIGKSPIGPEISSGSAFERSRPFVPTSEYVSSQRNKDALGDSDWVDTHIKAARRRLANIPRRSPIRGPSSPFSRWPRRRSPIRKSTVSSSKQSNSGSPDIRQHGPFRRQPRKAPAMPQRPSWSDAKYNNDFKNFQLFNEDTAKWFAAQRPLSRMSVERDSNGDAQSTTKPSSPARESPPEDFSGTPSSAWVRGRVKADSNIYPEPPAKSAVLTRETSLEDSRGAGWGTLNPPEAMRARTLERHLAAEKEKPKQKREAKQKEIDGTIGKPQKELWEAKEEIETMSSKEPRKEKEEARLQQEAADDIIILEAQFSEQDALDAVLKEKKETETEKTRVQKAKATHEDRSAEENRPERRHTEDTQATSEIDSKKSTSSKSYTTTSRDGSAAGNSLDAKYASNLDQEFDPTFARTRDTERYMAETARRSSPRQRSPLAGRPSWSASSVISSTPASPRRSPVSSVVSNEEEEYRPRFRRPYANVGTPYQQPYSDMPSYLFNDNPFSPRPRSMRPFGYPGAPAPVYGMPPYISPYSSMPPSYPPTRPAMPAMPSHSYPAPNGYARGHIPVFLGGEYGGASANEATQRYMARQNHANTGSTNSRPKPNHTRGRVSEVDLKANKKSKKSERGDGKATADDHISSATDVTYSSRADGTNSTEDVWETVYISDD